MNISEPLKTFLKHCEALPGPIPHSVRLGSANNEKCLLFTGILHGNEIGSLPAFNQFIENWKPDIWDGEILLVAGNCEAYKQNKRFIDEDLNRAFDHPSPSIEGQRALELSKLIDRSQLYIDFHQTIGPTESPFYIFTERSFNIKLSRFLQISKYATVRKKGETLSEGRKTSGEYAESKGIPALCIELSQKGINAEAEKIALKVMNDICQLFNKKSLSESQIPFSDFNISRLQAVHREPFESPMKRLKPNLINLQAIKKNEELGTLEDGNPFFAPMDGYIFFPKYPERDEQGKAIGPLPYNIVVIAQDEGFIK